MADLPRIRLTDLRRLARDALGEDATVSEYGAYSTRVHKWVAGYEAVGEHCLVRAWDVKATEARRQLRDLLQLIVAGKAASTPPRVHPDCVRVLSDAVKELEDAQTSLAEIRKRHGIDRENERRGRGRRAK